MLLAAQRAVVVVELQLAGRGVARDGVEPAGQPDQQAGGLPLEQLGRPVGGLGQTEAAAGRADGEGVADLGLDAHDVGHKRDLPAGCEAGIIVGRRRASSTGTPRQPAGSAGPGGTMPPRANSSSPVYDRRSAEYLDATRAGN